MSGPHATAAVLTAVLATPVENLTVAQLQRLEDVVRKVPGGHAPGITIGNLPRYLVGPNFGRRHDRRPHQHKIAGPNV